MTLYRITIFLFVLLLFAGNSYSEEPLDLFVKGALSPEGLRQIGRPESSINEEDLKKSQSATVGEALSREPGISSSSFGPGASRPIIRGQAGGRVRVIQNGVELGDVSASSDDHAVTSDPIATKRIDIIRGPSTLLYGSQAIGGVVNIIDDVIKEEHVGKEFTGKLDIKKGDSADETLSNAFSIEGEEGSTNWHLSGSFLETEDIEIPGYAESRRLREHEEQESEEGETEEHSQGTLPNSAINNKSFKFGISEVFSNGFFGISYGRTDSNYGVPGHSHEEHDEHEEDGHEDEHEDEHDEELHLEESDDVAIDLIQNRFETRGEFELNDNFFKAVRFGAVYSDYQHKELEGGAVGTLFERDSAEIRTFLTHKHEDLFEGGLGFQLNYDETRVAGDEAFIPSSETVNPAIFFLEDFPVGNSLTLQFGGRYEFLTIDPENYSTKDFNLFSGSTGLSWFDTTKTYNAGLTFSYSERAPNASELFANGVHVATQTFEVGDDSLSKERSVGTEIHLSKIKGPFRGDFNVFWQRYLNYLNLEPSGEQEENTAVFEYEEIDSEFWGMELSGEYDFYSHEDQIFTLYSSLDYVRAKNLTDNSNLPRITPLRAKLGLKHTLGAFSSYFEAFLVDSQKDTAKFELPTDSYALLEAGVNYQLDTSFVKGLELYAKGTNLTDEEARIHSSFLKDIAPQRGRAFFVGLRSHF